MGNPATAWGLILLMTGGAWAVIMGVGLVTIPRDYLQARLILGFFAVLGLLLATAGFLALTG